VRIRTIKPEFFLHDGLYEAEKETGLPLRVAFAGLWCASDKEGRFRWEPRRLGVAILPYDEVDFSRVLDALATRGFLVKYRVKDVILGCIPSFKRHQFVNNKEIASVLPDPSEGEDITRVPDAYSSRDERVKGERKGKEGDRERKGMDGAACLTRALPDASKFSPPSLEEVKLQCAKVGLPESEAEKFIDYHATRGWKLKGQRMQSWPHALGTWKSNWNAGNYGPTTPQRSRNHTEAPGEHFIAGRDEQRKRRDAIIAAEDAAMDGPVPL